MSHLKHYIELMRLHRPAGFMLLMWPCWWGVLLATETISGSVQNINYFLLFILTLGSIIVRGAGCVINDIADRKIDAQVERTKNRPLASGALNVTQALVFLGILLLGGLYVFLQLNTLAKLLSLAAFGVAVIYPFAKRFFPVPQLILGIAFNSGALIGYATVTGYVDTPAVMLYIAGISWTLAYDTIYAHQDKKYDVNIGVNSSALFFGKYNRFWIATFFDITWALVLAAAWLRFGFSVIGVVAILAVIFDFAKQVTRIDFDDEKQCAKYFKHNAYISGGLISLTIVLFSL
jgi:4-hydroxybenzoate polyprenyltransferase